VQYILSSIFREIWRHCNCAPLLCPINVTSSSSHVHVFRLQYPEVIHCRIVPIEKLKTLVVLELRGVSANLRVTFKLLLLNSDMTTVMGGFSFQVQLMFSIFELGLFYNEVLLDNVIQIHMKTKKWYLSGKEAASH
jgi:hypothetical protein